MDAAIDWTAQRSGTLWILVGSSLLLYILQRYRDFHRQIASTGYLPGYRSFLDAHSPIGYLLQTHRRLIVGGLIHYQDKFTPYKQAECDVISVIPMWPKSRVTLFVADPMTIKEIVSQKDRFPKDVQLYRSLNQLGGNIVASAGLDWKRYRKVSAPAFSERNNKLVWDETAKIMLDVFDNTWEGRDQIAMDNCLDLTIPITLQVIGVAGFGKSITSQDDTIPPGHKMTFKEVLKLVSEDVFLYIVTPNWFPGVTKRIQNIRLAFNELRLYTTEMIEQKRQESRDQKVERYDLFSSLMDASEDEGNTGGLTDLELMSNIFIFLLAGHETTAHTLCYTFALLALYPYEQEKLYKHCTSVPIDGEVPTYQQMGLFTQALAVFYETLRMFPSVGLIPKIAAEDTVLITACHDGQTRSIPVQKGASVMINTPGLHYNSRYWDDPTEFKPDRFLGQWPKDCFAPFSVGSRSCMGRKFAETESIAVIVMLIQRYKVTVTEEPQFATESFEEKKERVLASRNGLTLTPTRTPLTFTRRH